MVLSLLAAGGLAVGSGCIGVAADTTQIGDTSNTEVVPFEGHLYVVNKKTGEVREVDLSRVKKFPAKGGPRVESDESVTLEAADAG
jgi:hypothetical protein